MGCSIQDILKLSLEKSLLCDTAKDNLSWVLAVPLVYTWNYECGFLALH